MSTSPRGERDIIASVDFSYYYFTPVGSRLPGPRSIASIELSREYLESRLVTPDCVDAQGRLELDRIQKRANTWIEAVVSKEYVPDFLENRILFVERLQEDNGAALIPWTHGKCLIAVFLERNRTRVTCRNCESTFHVHGNDERTSGIALANELFNFPSQKRPEDYSRRQEQGLMHVSRNRFLAEPSDFYYWYNSFDFISDERVIQFNFPSYLKKSRGMGAAGSPRGYFGRERPHRRPFIPRGKKCE